MESPGTSHSAFLRPFANPTFLLLAALGVIIGVRLATLGTLALTDNTEARYAEISWQMFRSGDWVTPRLYVGGKLVPFQAKPPLLFWLTAASFEVFGASEWAARLPNFLIAAAVVAGTIIFGRRFWGARVGALAGVILASSGLFFVLSGSCVLDMALAACVCLAMMSFAIFAVGQSNQTLWGRVFFVSLGLGCLAKGPLAVVLVGLSVGTWIAATRQWRLLRRLPWSSGTLLASVIAVPWYLLAERATPGFLHYFLIQEHILRYVRSDYGDLYGSGRTQPYGASWVMLTITFLPWIPWVIQYGFNRWRHRHARSAVPGDTWLLYALVWGLTPAVFFTFCRQILVTYMLPGFPALALATAVVLVRWLDSAEVSALVKGLRNFCIGLGVLLGIGLSAEVAFAVSPWVILATSGAVAAFFAVAWRGHCASDAWSLLSAVGVGTALLIAVGSIGSASWIAEAFSAKTILETVARSRQDGEHSVLLPLDDACSADFYQETRFGGHVSHPQQYGFNLLVEKLHEPSHEVIVLKRKQWDRELDERLRGSLVLFAETAHWIACRARKREPISSAAAAANLHSVGN